MTQPSAEARAVRAPSTYTYEDRQLDPPGSITVETAENVFYPTSTTNLLLRAARRHAPADVRSALDLGCGCGIVAIALRKFLVGDDGWVGASDLSSAAVELTRSNAARAGVELDVRCGSVFEPWEGARFDLIVDDVAAVAEPIARSSRWYPEAVPSEAGDDGTRWITTVLREAPTFLNPEGRLVFPLLTLAAQEKVLDTATSLFRTVQLLEEQWYPLTPELNAQLELLQQLAADGVVEIRQRGSRWLWATKIYVAADPR